MTKRAKKWIGLVLLVGAVIALTGSSAMAHHHGYYNWGYRPYAYGYYYPPAVSTYYPPVVIAPYATVMRPAWRPYYYGYYQPYGHYGHYGRHRLW